MTATRREREIWQACEDLYSLEMPIEKITGDAIRERLSQLGYSKGSPNEVYKYRKSWRESKGHASVIAPVLSDPITRAASLMHEQLKAEAQLEIDKVKQIAKEQMDLSQAEKANLHEKLREFTVQLNQIQQSAQQLQDAHESLQKQHRDREIALELANQRLSLLQAQADQELTLYKQNRQQLTEAYQSNLQLLQQQFNSEKNYLLTEIAATKKVAENKIALYASTIDNLLCEKNQLEKAIIIKQNNIEQLIAVGEQHNDKISNLQDQLQSKEVEAAKQYVERQALTLVNMQLKTEIETIQHFYIEVRQSSEARLADYLAERERVMTLEEKLHFYQDEIEKLKIMPI